MGLTLSDDHVERRPLLDLKDQAGPPHTPEYQDAQAAKMHVALGDQSPGLSTVTSLMTVNNADAYKRILGEREQIRQNQAQNDILESVLTADPSTVTPEVVDTVQGLSMLQMQSPDLGDIVEREYAKKYVNTAATMMGNDILDDAMTSDPEAAHTVLDRAENFSYKQNYLNTILDEAQKGVEDQSWMSTVYNLGENLLIGNYQTYNQVGSEVDLNDLPSLPGRNRIEGYAFLWGLDDPKEFKTYMDSIANDLKSRNPYAFREWFQGMVSFGNSDAVLNNLTTGMDIASLIPIGKLGSAMKAVVRGSKMNPMKLSEVTATLGKNLDSGAAKIAEEVEDGSFLGGIKNAKELEKTVPNLLSADKAMVGGTDVSRAAYGRLKDAILENGEIAKKILATNTIDRLTPSEVIYLRDDLAKQYVKDHPQISKSVIDVRAGDVDVGNVYNAKIILGQRSGELFESEKQAQTFVSRYVKPQTNDYQIVQNGEGFEVQINKTLDESKLFDLKLDLNQQTPRSISDFSKGLSYVRTPVEKLSQQQNVARSVLTTSKEKVDELFSEMSQPIGALSKKELSELDDLLFVNQKEQKFYDNIGEFAQAFYDRHKKAPTEKQAEAYFAYTNISDLDLVIRDLDWYKQKAAAGFEDISIDLKADRGPDQTEFWKQSFEGKVVDDLPYTDPTPFKVGIVKDGRLKTVKFSPVMNEGDRAAIKKLQADGYKIVNAVESGFNIDGKYLDYVLVKNFKRERVGVKNVDRKPGGHKIVRDPYYVKQGKIAGEEGYNLYRGDQTFFNFRSEAEANKFRDILEEVRQKLLNQTEDAVKFARDNLPIPTREFMAAVSDGSIDLKVPFAVTRSGGRTIDTGAYKALNLKDVTRSSHKPADQITGRFAGERSEADVSAIRSEGDTKWRVEGAAYLSPLEAMKTASSDMISARLFDDYKIMTTKNFIREFGDVLEGSLNELKSQGLSVIQNPRFNQTLEKTPEGSRKIQRAKNISVSFNTLMDNSNKFSRSVDLFKERLLAPIIPKLSNRGTQEWLSENMMSRTRDPSSFLKSAAFHMKMGFWNPTQYFKQANAAVNIVSVGGINGMRGVASYLPMRWALHTNNPKTIAMIGSKLEKVGLIKGDDFVEMMGLYKKSGFNDIGGDVAYLDDLRSPELVRSTVKRTADKVMRTSATPFYEGERMSRLAGFMTAYLDKKAALKGMKIDRRAEADILYRAKTLIGNMTREANSPWQKGYQSVITQFFGYQARIMDQFLGKQLTATEKARLFVGYSMVYGLPVGVGAVTGVLPVRDIILDQMYEHGMDPQNPMAKPFIDGLVSTMTDFMFGKDWNIASSYGPGGVPTFYDMFRGDKDFADLLMGASGGIAASTIPDLLSGSWKGLKAIWSETSDFDGGLYNLAAEDLIRAARNITSVNSIAQVIHAYNFGMWTSKNGFDIAKMDLPDAVMAAITGLTPAGVEQSYAKLSASKSLKEAREAAKTDLIKRLRDARKIESGRTRESVIRSIKAEIELWGFNPHEKSQISRYAWDSKTLEDISLDQYEKEMQRKSIDLPENQKGE